MIGVVPVNDGLRTAAARLTGLLREQDPIVNGGVWVYYAVIG